jgi:hypothetical protein
MIYVNAQKQNSNIEFVYYLYFLLSPQNAWNTTATAAHLNPLNNCNILNKILFYMPYTLYSLKKFPAKYIIKNVGLKNNKNAIKPPNILLVMNIDIDIKS